MNTPLILQETEPRLLKLLDDLELWCSSRRLIKNQDTSSFTEAQRKELITAKRRCTLNINKILREIDELRNLYRFTAQLIMRNRRNTLYKQ